MEDQHIIDSMTNLSDHVLCAVMDGEFIARFLFAYDYLPFLRSCWSLFCGVYSNKSESEN